MSSKRFPGKVLYEVENSALLHFLLKRLEKSKNLQGVMVATSNHPSDLPIVEFCQKHHYSYYCGDLENVANRFVGTLRQCNIPVFVRINGDSPFIDYRLVDECIDVFLKNDFDVVTNVLHRTYPKGQSVELLRSEVFLETVEKFCQPEDFEHVTPYFYRHAQDFKIYNLKCVDPWNAASMNFCIDTPQDVERLKNMFENIKKMNFEPSWQAFLSHPSWTKAHAKVC